MSEEEDSYKHYRETVKVLAAEAEESGDVELACDGNYWTIYTHAAIKLLQYSRNEDAFFEAGADLTGITSFQDLMTTLAFYALCADVRAEMERGEDRLRDIMTDDTEDEDG